jgi:hypothetical protein
MNLSNHLTLKEVIKSNTATRKGIDNTPTTEHEVNLYIIAEHIFEPIRVHFGVPIGISSGYRGKELNRAVGGSRTSDHCKGMALDIDADIYGKLANVDIFNYIKDNLEFKQLIWEFGTGTNPNWVHVSYDPNNNKKQILVASKKNGRTVYSNYNEKSI